MSDESEAQALEPTDRAIVEVAGGLTAVTLENVQAQIQLLDAIRRAAVSYTAPSQWIDFSGKPYMMGSAGSSIAMVLGLSVYEPKYERLELPGPGRHVQITATVTVGRGDRTWTDHDDCTSFDDMLPARRKELETRGATADAVELILESAIKKKAFAGALGRAVSGWLGLRDQTWEHLESLGLSRKKAGGAVQHRRGTVAAATPVSIAELKRLPKGSTAQLGAMVTSIDQKQGAKGPYCNLGMREGDEAVWVRMWHAAPEWLVPHTRVHFGKIEVGEYQGVVQYIGHDLTQVDVANAKGEQDGNAERHEPKRNTPGSAVPASSAARKPADADAGDADAWEDERIGGDGNVDRYA